MGKKVFKTDLSIRGIENLKKQLLDYKNIELHQKLTTYIERLGQIAINVSETKVSESPLGKYIHVRIESDGLFKRRVVIAGEVKHSEKFAPFSTVLAVEFGSGIHYNQQANPNASKYGFGVGTFPGQIHAFEDGWYYWNEKEQRWGYTQGVKATMPMYESELAIIKNATRIALEVFG